MQGEEGLSVGDWIQLTFLLVVTIFQGWMFIDALRRKEYLWAFLNFISSGLTAVLYYFMVYRPAGGGNPLSGFELPGAVDRRRIKELKRSIHDFDRAHHYVELGDIYFAQGRLSQAEAAYRAAYQREPEDEDVRAHLGTCLARQGKAKEALPLLESVCAANPKHDYGYTLMAWAEALTAAGEPAKAAIVWQHVLASYTYARARVQYAELLLGQNKKAEAQTYLAAVLEDEQYAPKFQRKREAVWVDRARALMRKTV